MERVSSIHMGAAISNFAQKDDKDHLLTPAILIISERLHSFDHA